ncbi:MAG: replicative DNA helicase [Clostridia bacterium]|nr:replicative DNA helicase [Clostridia bacterium]
MDEIQRKLPYAAEAEQSVLGSILIDPEAFSRVATLLSPDDFYLSENRAVYEAMQQMFAESKRIDDVLLINRLVEGGSLDKAGGIQYLKLLGNAAKTSANILDYARIVADKSRLRRLIETCADISDAAFLEEGRVQDIIGSAEQKIYDLSNDRDQRDFRPLDQLIVNIYDQLEKLSRDDGSEQRTMTGFSGLDKVLLGMGPGDLVLIGARPGMGKTSFALNVAANVARQTGKTVCIFSLEMSGEQLASRMLASEGMISSGDLRTGKLSEEAWARLSRAAERLGSCKILVDDTAGVTLTQMRAKLRRVEKGTLGMIVIDYLQLMQSDRRFDSRVNEVSDISRNLKLLAKDFGVPVLCCAQLSRQPENRKESEGGKRPMISDLRESGSIEQDADVVLLLYSEDYYKRSEEERSELRPFEVIVGKNRHGETRTVKLGWIPQYTKFRTLSPEDEERFREEKAKKDE